MQERLTVTDDQPQPAPLPDFTPVPKKYYRHDGWTPERQHAFIKALAECGSVVEAARHVGMSHGTAYTLRNEPGAEGFSAAWDTALVKATSRVHDVLVDHAVNGAAEPIMYGGEQVAEFRRYNYRMMMWLLRHHQPEKFGGSANGGTDSALSRHRMRLLKEQWHEEWQAEGEARGKRLVAEDREKAAQRQKEHDERFHTKINDMRQKMIAHYIAKDPATDEPHNRFNPKGASPMELLIYDEVSGGGASEGKELREEMGFPPRSGDKHRRQNDAE